MADTENYFETELLQDLDAEIRAGAIVIAPDSAEYFDKLAQCYPVCGSKIHWGKVPGAIEFHEGSDDLQQTAFSDFFREMLARHGLSGPAVYMADGAVDFSILSSMEIFFKHLELLLSMPQHHYFVAADYSWCMVFTHEGDMSFGYSPKPD